MSVIKRSPKASSAELVQAIDELIPYLKDQGEHDACADLDRAAQMIRNSEVGSSSFKEGIRLVIDAFEGEHELSAYTITRNTNQWGDAEVLSAASSRVISLARRLQ